MIRLERDVRFSLLNLTSILLNVDFELILTIKYLILVISVLVKLIESYISYIYGDVRMLVPKFQITDSTFISSSFSFCSLMSLYL